MRVKHVFTIGYEGADLMNFLGTLRARGVDQVIDVRAIPLSRKRGFSKKALTAALAAEGIAYVHIRELGDPKPGRDAARRGNFAKFRTIYAQHLKGADAQEGLRVAANAARETPSCLLCFERMYEHCHRSMVAAALAKIGGFAITHLSVRKDVRSHAKAAYERDGDPALALG